MQILDYAKTSDTRDRYNDASAITLLVQCLVNRHCFFSFSIQTVLIQVFLPERTIRPRGYKTFLMLNSTEHERFPAHNVKMPTVVGILTFMSRKNNIPGLSEP